MREDVWFCLEMVVVLTALSFWRAFVLFLSCDPNLHCVLEDAFKAACKSAVTSQSRGLGAPTRAAVPSVTSFITQEVPLAL